MITSAKIPCETRRACKHDQSQYHHIGRHNDKGSRGLVVHPTSQCRIDSGTTNRDKQSLLVHVRHCNPSHSHTRISKQPVINESYAETALYGYFAKQCAAWHPTPTH